MQGEWVRKPSTDTAVVFVHGFLSSGATCWQHEDGGYWPNLVKTEAGFLGHGIYVFSYQTGIFSGTYSLSDVVDSLKEHMRIDKVSPCRNVIFVCHSMGGIVVRKYLVERAHELIEAKCAIGLFLVASPSLGSDYANWLSPIAKLLNHTQADALRFVNDNLWLSGLDKEFKNLKEGGKLQLKGKELVEDRFVTLHGFWRKQVVAPFSGAVYFGEPYKVPASDHFSIAKPASDSSIQHKLLVHFIQEFLAQSDRFSSKELLAAVTMPPTIDAEAFNTASAISNSAQSAPEPRNAASMADLLADLCSKDPMLAIPAGLALAAQADNELAIIDRPRRSYELVQSTAVRMALRGKKNAAAILTSRILSPESGWHLARTAANDLDPSHREYCASALAAALERSGRDTSRILFEALGNLGAVEWGWQLFEFFETVQGANESRYASFALESFANMFVLARNADDAKTASDLLCRALLLDELRKSNGYHPFAMRLTLGKSKGLQIDCYLKDWVLSESALIRGIAADALGDCGVHRSIPTLERLLRDREGSVRSAASNALGMIGTKDSLAALDRSAPDSSGVSLCLHQVADDRQFQERAKALLIDAGAFRWAVIRSVGLRRLTALSDEVRSLVHSADELERGCAMLALARLGDSADYARIETGLHESSGNSFEKIMATLAVLTVAPDRFSSLEGMLRETLVDMSYAFWKPAQSDILSVLDAVGNPRASELADAWRPFYSGYRPKANS